MLRRPGSLMATPSNASAPAPTRSHRGLGFARGARRSARRRLRGRRSSAAVAFSGAYPILSPPFGAAGFPFAFFVLVCFDFVRSDGCWLLRKCNWTVLFRHFFSSHSFMEGNAQPNLSSRVLLASRLGGGDFPLGEEFSIRFGFLPHPHGESPVLRREARRDLRGLE